MQQISAKVVLPSATKLFGETWKVYAGNFLVLTVITLIPTLFGLLFQFLRTAIPITNTSGLILLIFVGIFTLLVEVASCGAAMKAIQSIDVDGHASLVRAYGRGLDRAWPLFGLVLLITLMVDVGLILLIIPGIILFVWLSLGIYTFTFEKLGIIDSLGASKNYIHGHFWNVLWKWLFLLIVFGICAIVFAKIGVSVRLPEDIFVYIMSFLMIVIYVPLSLIYGSLLYRYLKAEKSPQVAV